MKRVVFASVAMLAIAIAAVLVIPRVGHKPDARSILIAAAQAAEQAKSVYIVGHGTADSKDTPSGMGMQPGQFKAWLGMGDQTAMYFRDAMPDGRLVSVASLDPRAGTWSVYDAAKQTQYLADLSPIAAKAAQVVTKAAQLFRDTMLTGAIMEMERNRFPDTKMSSSTGTRNDRKTTVVTLTFTARTSPKRVTQRIVFEIDADTNRLMTMRQYAQAEGSPEELVGDIEKVEYDVPVPAELGALTAPGGTRTVRAVATIEETAQAMSLVMKADGLYLRTDVPRK